MSFKNTPQMKKIRRLERALRKGRLPVYFNLVEWLQDRKYAQTKGEAIQMITDGRVVSDSHALGKQIIEVGGPTLQEPERQPEKREVLKLNYPVALRSTIQIKES